MQERSSKVPFPAWTTRYYHANKHAEANDQELCSPLSSRFHLPPNSFATSHHKKAFQCTPKSHITPYHLRLRPNSKPSFPRTTPRYVNTQRNYCPRLTLLNHCPGIMHVGTFTAWHLLPRFIKLYCTLTGGLGQAKLHLAVIVA